MAESSSNKDVVRFTRGRKCPICDGCIEDPRHHGARCHGFQAGDWAHCSREEHAGQARFYSDSATYAHRVRGKCPCGVEHAPEEKPARRRVAKVYQYRDASGDVLFEAVRYTPKGFSQRRPGPDGRPIYNLKGVELVPYQLDFLVHAPLDAPVWIVEGEKDADRLYAADKLATCNPMGAGKWREAYSRHLNGRTCYIIPDNDAVGVEHAKAVARSLQKEAKSIRIVSLPGLPDHGDLSDWLDAGGTMEELASLAESAKELIGVDLTPAVSPAPAPPSPDPRRSQSHADLLIRMGLERGEFWRTPSGEAYATLPQKGTIEDFPVNSSRMTDWLFDAFLTEHDEAPMSDALATARAVFQSRARIHGKTHRPWIRVGDQTEEGTKDYVFWLDLCDREGHAVRITAKGWEVVKNPPVKFLRPDVMKALPTPEKGGSLDELWDFVNVEPADRPLMVAALTSFMRPRGPYPLLVLGGEQGSAKSTTTRVLKRLVDDRTPILGSLPESPLDLWVVAGSNWLLTFDNISSISKGMSNALCQLALEGGMERRKLHTDSEVSVLEAMRPMILNGIDEFARAPDLVDRVVMLTCPKIGDAGRREEDELWARFYQARPRILGALCDAIAGGLAVQPTVRLDVKPRMADFAIWGEAVCRHLGHAPGEFLDAMVVNRDASSSMALEDSPVASAIFELGHGRTFWGGTCKELLTALRETPGASDHGGMWPRSPRGLASHIRRIQPGLRREGVTVHWAGKVRHERLVEISWVFGASPPTKTPF